MDAVAVVVVKVVEAAVVVTEVVVVSVVAVAVAELKFGGGEHDILKSQFVK